MSFFLLQKNLKHQRTVPYSPQQNGQAERRNQTVMGMARCILIESKLPHDYWSFAVHFAVYTLNRLPTRRINWKTPHELWTGIKPNVTHLRPFGCTAYAHIDSSLRSSIQPTSAKCRFLGYAPYQKGYILQYIQNNVICVRRDVTFDENSFISLPDELPHQEQESDPMETIDDQSLDFAIQSHHTSTEYPKSYQEAMTLPDAEKWHQAALEELASHEKNGTWTLTKLPKNANAIQSRWIFTKKRLPTGEERYKARLVAKGYTQRFGIDYHETYSSVIAGTSLRFLICIAVNKNWKIYHYDFTTAYLNAPLLIPLYLQKPEGFVQHGGDKTEVCMLNKALFGLKQAGRAWQHELIDAMNAPGFQRSEKEPCMFFKQTNNHTTLIGTYVDDLLITGDNHEEITNIKNTWHPDYR